jgi:hypothetical protein
MTIVSLKFPQKALSCTLLTASLLSACATDIGSGDGKVIDYVSREPIPGAAVQLTCTVPRLAHGSDKIVLNTESGPDGSFHFDPTGLHGCDYFFARAVKPGYGLDGMTDSLTRSTPDSGRRIPKAVFLIKESDQPKALLERLSDFMPVGPLTAGPYLVSDFYGAYKRLMSSRRIATTPELAAWVRERYCTRLATGWAVMSAQQRAGLKEDGNSPLDGSPISLRPESFERDVRPYCEQNSQ